jgi:alpha/beta superfamily hydrolase
MLVDLVQTTTRDGVRLDGIYQPPATASAALRLDAVCMVHGTGGSFYSSSLFDGFAERFLQSGVAVLRVNTRGHDLMSNAATTTGGRRLGAAYEVVDDCRHDLAAWISWLRQKGRSQIGLLGHSLGAVKCLYAAAKEPDLNPSCIVALSPPRLSYSWFVASPEGPQFQETFDQAERHVQSGRPSTLLEVKLPLPFVVTAEGYVEKYGPEERYNYLRFVSDVSIPLLVTLGSIEVEKNMAFRAAPQALKECKGRLTVEAIAGADHFYTGVREVLLGRVDSWLRARLPA